MGNGEIKKAEEWPELIEFALAMRDRLDEKELERGRSWKEESPEKLFDVLVVHYERLYTKIRKEEPANIKKKAVDLANLAMMIYDVASKAGMSRDIMADFVTDHCVVDPDKRTAFRDVYNRFHLWYQSDVGGVPLGAGWFERHFPEKFNKSSEKGEIFYTGVSLVRACRVCGCTEENACDGGCYWVDDPEGGDLCSRCAEEISLKEEGGKR